LSTGKQKGYKKYDDRFVHGVNYFGFAALTFVKYNLKTGTIIKKTGWVVGYVIYNVSLLNKRSLKGLI